MNITVKDIVKKYGNRTALHIKHITFEPGKIYAILGLNGSGKTTLIECIAGLISYEQGEIIYEGFQDIKSVRADISICTQKQYLFRKSVYENIISGLKFRKAPKEIIKDRVDRYLKYYPIDHLINKNARELSVGEGAKTALLRTAVLETDVTLLDEPTASMDIESTLLTEKLIKDMATNNRMVILVTHDIFQAKRIADEIIFMDKGAVLERGSKLQVFSNPKSDFLKKILAI